MNTKIYACVELIASELEVIGGGCACYCHNQHSFPHVFYYGEVKSLRACSQGCVDSGFRTDRCD